MNAIHELAPGQAHQFVLAALNVTLTGSSAQQPDLSSAIELRAVDQAGQESVTVRLTSLQVILTPEPRRLRLMAFPTRSETFSPNTVVGLTVRTEGTANDQALVPPVDVGSLASFELAVLEFAPGRSVLTAAGIAVASVPGGPATPDVSKHPWLRAGQYAVREAEMRAPGAIPSDAVSRWGLVLDGSASVQRTQAALTDLVQLGAGINTAHSRAWPVQVLVTGPDTAVGQPPTSSPEQLLEAVTAAPEASSWCHLAGPARALAEQVGPGGRVLMAAAAVPGDVADLAEVARAHHDVAFQLLVPGTSVHGLPADAAAASGVGAEQHLGTGSLTGLANVRVVSVGTTDEGTAALSDPRPAQLALALLGTGGAV